MRLLIYIVAAAVFFAFFAYTSRYYGDDQLYQYIGYAFLVCAFVTLLIGIRDYTDEGRLVKFNKKEARRIKKENYKVRLSEISGRSRRR